MWTCVNYVAGAFVAGALAQVAGSLSPAKFGVIVFSCAAVYISCRAYVRLAQALEGQEKGQSATQVASQSAA